MKRHFAAFALLALALLAAPRGPLAAQAYQGAPDPVEYLQFLGGSGVNGGYGVQVGPYAARFAGDPAGTQFSIYCVDYTHYAQSQWVTTSALGGSLASTRLGADPQAYEKYWKAAYLASLFEDAPTTAWGAIHAAIWQYTSGVTLGGAALAADRQAYYDLASAVFADAASVDFDASAWYVVSPTLGADGQEFLLRIESVPEPAAFILLASGLLALAAVSRRRLGGSAEIGT